MKNNIFKTVVFIISVLFSLAFVGGVLAQGPTPVIFDVEASSGKDLVTTRSNAGGQGYPNGATGRLITRDGNITIKLTPRDPLFDINGNKWEWQLIWGDLGSIFNNNFVYNANSNGWPPSYPYTVNASNASGNLPPSSFNISGLQTDHYYIFGVSLCEPAPQICDQIAWIRVGGMDIRATTNATDFNNFTFSAFNNGPLNISTDNLYLGWLSSSDVTTCQILGVAPGGGVNTSIGGVGPITRGSASFPTTSGTSYILSCNFADGNTYVSDTVRVTDTLVASPPTVTTPTHTAITTTGATLGATVTADGGSAITARGTCWNTTGAPVTENCKPEGGTSLSVFSHGRNLMPSGTTIYYRGYATNSASLTGYSTNNNFNTLPIITLPPTVTTPTHTAITTTGATLGATVTADGGASLTARGTCWNTTGAPITQNCTSEGGTAISIFSHARTGMPSGTTIYYRGYATNSASLWGYSTNGQFNTLAPSPMSGTLLPASSSCTISVGASSCTSSTLTWTTTNPVATSAVTNNGGATPASPSGNNSSSTFTVPYNSGMGGVTTFYLYNNSAIPLALATVTTNLDPSCTWNGIICVGNTTPTVTTTTPVTSITATTATGGGTISSDGGATVTVSGIVWSTSAIPTTGAPTLSTKTTNGWAIGGPWTSNMTGLTASTLYNVRAYATNSVGTSYGANVTFTTISGVGPSGTLSATSCTIPLNASTCSASVLWTTANLTANPTAITRNTGNPASFTPSPLASGSQAVTLGNGTTTFYLFHNSSELANTNATPANATCASGSTWNVGTGTCVANAGMSGTLSGPNCTISSGASSCTTTLTWNVSNPENVGGSEVTSPYPSAGTVVAPPVSTGTADSGTKTSVTVPYSSRTFYLYNNAKSLVPTSPNGAGIAVTATCASGSTWNGSTCAANALPTVTSPTSSNITLTSATLGATVTSLGSPASISARGTCWNTTGATITQNCAPASGLTTGLFTHARSGLPSGTLIYYRGYANNATSGIGYSANATFSTPAGSTVSVSCSSDLYAVQVNQNVIWTANASGGSGTYTSYTWTGSDIPTFGTQGVPAINKYTIGYPTAGQKDASVTVTDSVGNVGVGSCIASATNPNVTNPNVTVYNKLPTVIER